jgi:hypothetical protein
VSCLTGLLDENEKAGKRYDQIKAEFAQVALQNRALQRGIAQVDEMVRATGGDVKVIPNRLTERPSTSTPATVTHTGSSAADSLTSRVRGFDLIEPVPCDYSLSTKPRDFACAV